jgi:small neutral amino acid transporter SnatA (MarC family)
MKVIPQERVVCAKFDIYVFIIVMNQVHDSVYCMHIVVILMYVYCVCISFSKVVLEEFLCNSSMGYTTRIHGLLISFYIGR